MKAPFPYFGGKSRVAPLVWQRLGDTLNYIEPFFGSGAVLLARPFPVRIETVNDRDPYVSNFFRALQAAPDEVAYYCDYPVIETDLHARHLWLVNQGDFRERMLADPEYYDAKIAGWWVWGLSAWIGSGWCNIDGYAYKRKTAIDTTDENRRPQLGNGQGQGVHTLSIQRPNLRPKQGVEGVPAQTPRLSGSQGVHGKRPFLQHHGGVGVHRPSLQLPHVGGSGRGDAAPGLENNLYTYLEALADRLRRVRVCCGDWSRIMGPSVTYLIGTTAVFLDPPYSDVANRASDLYGHDSLDIAHEVREWCLANGDNPLLRIALCGYEGEHNELEAAGWDAVAWRANGGYGGQRKDGTKNENAGKERIWYSPHCLRPMDAIMSGKRGGLNGFEDLPIFSGMESQR